MSAPRTKRQFAGDSASPAQRTITSYFASRSSDSSTSSPSTSIATPSTSSNGYPVLPPAVQTNLLSVGMRVRKSVPEGYKTGSDSYSGFKLFTNNDTVAPSSTSLKTSKMARTNELLPFCGIHKVGGLAPQVGSNEDLPAIDDVPGLSRSQESMISEAGDESWGGRASRKRFISDEEEEEVRRGLHDSTLMDAGLEAAAGRTIAVPRRRKADIVVPTRVQAKSGSSGDDFEDAEFLAADAFVEKK